MAVYTGKLKGTEVLVNPTGMTNTTENILQEVLSDFDAAITAAGTTPAGSDKQVQFNDGGSFGGDAGLTFDKGTGVLTATTVNASGSTGSTIASFDSSKNIASLATTTYPSLTELSYVKGVTSAIQTQINAKQAADATLTAVAGVTTGGDLVPYFTGTDTATTTTLTSFGRSLIDDADATAGQATLGLGTMATQAASSVAITGGTISNVTTTGSNLYSLGLVRASSQYASIAVGSTTGLNFSGNFTVEAYINLFTLPASGQQYGVFGCWSASGTTNKSYAVMLENNAGAIGMRVDVTSDGSSSDTLRVASEYGATSWVHFAWAYNVTNKNFIAYINGVPVGTSGTGAQTSIQTATTGSYYLGSKYDATHFLNGCIGYVRAWDSQRSQANIAANMFKQLTTASGLKGNWKLQNDYNDASGNSNHMSATGSPVFTQSVPFVG